MLVPLYLSATYKVGVVSLPILSNEEKKYLLCAPLCEKHRNTN